MRPRRRTALNWRMRRTRRDALPSIQKEGSSLRRTFLASVGSIEHVVKHTCVCKDMIGDRRVCRSICGSTSTPPRLSAPTLSTL